MKRKFLILIYIHKAISRQKTTEKQQKKTRKGASPKRYVCIMLVHYEIVPELCSKKLNFK